jgi:hypothetical protein
MTPLARVVFVIVYGLLAGGTEPHPGHEFGLSRREVS